MLAVIVAVTLQQAAAGQVVWQAPAPPPAPAPIITETPAAPALPDWARADPYGYERSECSPLLRKAAESLEACQSRVRTALALDGDLPPGLSSGASAEACRQEAAGDRYALQCAPPGRTVPTGPDMRARECTTRPRSTAEGRMTFEETCTVNGEEVRDDGLRIRLGGD